MGKLIATDIDGIIRELRIREEDFLLAFFELVINSIQAIAEKGDTRNGKIDIYVEREEQVQNLFGGRAIKSVRIEDNGIGFTDKNYESFTRSHSTKKADIGGKGVGRFAVLSVFEEMQVSSTYRDENIKKIQFTLNREEGLSEPLYPKEGIATTTGTVVYVSRLNELFKEKSASYDLESIADSILEHCLLYYLTKQAPLIAIHEGNETINLSSQFSISDFIDKIYKDTVKGQEFQLYFVKGNKRRVHQYSLCANNRVVKSKNVPTVFPLFSSPIIEDNKPVFIRIYVISDYLNEIVNMSRNELDFPKRKETENNTRLYESDVDIIVVKAISSIFKQNVEERKNTTLKKIASFMAKDAGLPYRHLTISDSFLEGVSDDVKDEEIDEKLHALSYKKSAESRAKCQKLLERDYSNNDDYQKLLEEVVNATTAEGNLQLAQYIAKRKTVIALFEKYLAWMEETKDYTEEKTIHNLLFTMGGSNATVPYDQHNLWLLDDRLTFFGYITSDKAIRLHSPLEGQTDCGKETDIAVYDVPFIYGEKSDYGVINAVLIFELKRPGRQLTYEEFSKQMREQTLGIRSGKKVNEEGKIISTNESVPIHFYYVVDENAYGAIKGDAKMENFAETPFHSLYRTVNNTTQEILTYDSMLVNAKRRNQIFFAKLGIQNVL